MSKKYELALGEFSQNSTKGVFYMPIVKAVAKFEFNSDYETIHIPGNNTILDKLLNCSTSCIHIYNYLCLRAKKAKLTDDKKINFNNEIGIVRKINTRKISDSLGMNIRVVQLDINKLVESGLINIINEYSNKSNDKDIYISQYKQMYVDENYVKLDADTIFSNDFLKSPKSHVSLYLTTYISNYKQALANLQRAHESKDHKKVVENYKLINEISVNREFKEDTLLSKIKRVSKNDLADALEGIKKLGLDITESISISNPKLKKYIISAYSQIKKLFKPYNKVLTFREKYPFAFSIVKECISIARLDGHFQNGKEYDDLIQMYNEYDQVSFLAGLLRYKNYIEYRFNTLENKCGFIRKCITTFQGDYVDYVVVN